MDAREVIKILKKDGWYLVNQEGSHKQFRHPTKKGKVTVATHGHKDIPLKTLKNIFDMAGLKKP